MRSDWPADLHELHRYAACPVAAYSLVPTLPEPEGPTYRTFGLDEGRERLGYSRVESGLDVYEATGSFPGRHQLLGYSYALDGTPLLECYLAAHGILPTAEAQDAAEGTAGAEWRVLLQVVSDSDTGMDFGGGGLVYFCLPREALRARDYSHAWATMQFL